METKIQLKREECSMSRVELAKKSKLALSKVYLYESGKGNPTAKTLAKLAKALGCSVSELIEE